MTDIKKTLITSALPYINGIKHLGNLAGSLLPADIHARYRRQTGDDVLFICATDEHGTPAELAAAEARLPIAVYCAQQHGIQADIYRRLGISFDHFGRSSSPQNRALTQHFFKSLDDRGFIEERTLNQVYSLDDGRFLPDRYIVGTCPHCGSDRARGDQCENCSRLTEALPPLSTDLLTDVADALNQLEEDRRQLQEYQALARSVGHFTDRYRSYAKTQSRRQARGLRGAQTGFDNASRALNDARSELEALQAVEEEANAAQLVAKEAVSANRTRLEVLQSDPINKDANRLDFASKDAADRQRDAKQADVAARASKDRFLGEQNTTAERGERVGRVGRVGNSLLEVRKAAIPFVELGGIAVCTENSNPDVMVVKPAEYRV